MHIGWHRMQRQERRVKTIGLYRLIRLPFSIQRDQLHSDLHSDLIVVSSGIFVLQSSPLFRSVSINLAPSKTAPLICAFSNETLTSRAPAKRATARSTDSKETFSSVSRSNRAMFERVSEKSTFLTMASKRSRPTSVLPDRPCP